MEQHPIPRQITTFEYKLIGFMTIRQFGYVLLGAAFGYASFLIVPIFILNYIAGIVVFCISLAFAFFPVNDRPLDVFMKNLYQRLNSPTQYTFAKNNPPMRLMADLYFETNPHIMLAHADSKEKLATYLASKKAKQKDEDDRRMAITRINNVITTRPETNRHAEKVSHFPNILPATVHKNDQNNKGTTGSSIKTQTQKQPLLETQSTKHPFFSGTVTNTRNIALPGVLVYIKDIGTKNTLRILKTNPHGVFATFHPLPPHKYLIEIVDSSGNYKFDSAELFLPPDAEGGGKHTATFVSKELI